MTGWTFGLYTRRQTEVIGRYFHSVSNRYLGR